MKFAIGIGVLATVIPAAVGMAVLSSGHHLTVLVYSPLSALVAVPMARRWYVRRRFSHVATQMRSLLVPRLLDDAPEPMLLHLARFGAGTNPAEWKVLRVREDPTCVTIEVKYENQPGPRPGGWSQPSSS